MTKKVQEFFKDIQDLIFYMFQYQYYNSFDVRMNFQFIKEGFFKSKEKRNEEKKNMRKINYYVAKIKENYQYTKYIGLVGIVENEKMRLVDKTNITIYLDTKMTEELVKQFCIKYLNNFVLNICIKYLFHMVHMRPIYLKENFLQNMK